MTCKYYWLVLLLEVPVVAIACKVFGILGHVPVPGGDGSHRHKTSFSITPIVFYFCLIISSSHFITGWVLSDKNCWGTSSLQWFHSLHLVHQLWLPVLLMIHKLYFSFSTPLAACFPICTVIILSIIISVSVTLLIILCLFSQRRTKPPTALNGSKSLIQRYRRCWAHESLNRTTCSTSSHFFQFCIRCFVTIFHSTSQFYLHLCLLNSFHSSF